MTNLRELSPPEWCGTNTSRDLSQSLCNAGYYVTFTAEDGSGRTLTGPCVHDGDGKCGLNDVSHSLYFE